MALVVGTVVVPGYPEVEHGTTPYDTFNEKFRIQFILLEEELLAAGFLPGDKFMGLRLFTGASTPGKDLVNFRIRLQNTDLTESRDWVEDGWTLVYGPTTIPATEIVANAGYTHFFDVATFVWDGRNLLVDISRDDDTWASGGGNIVFDTGYVGRASGTYYSRDPWPFENTPAAAFDYIPKISFIANRPAKTFEENASVFVAPVITENLRTASTTTQAEPVAVRKLTTTGTVTPFWVRTAGNFVEKTAITPQAFKRDIFFVPLGVFWATEWKTSTDSVEVEVTGRDRLELLKKSTFSTAQVLQNKSLAELAEIVLQDAGLTSSEYVIDASLAGKIIPWAWFEPISHREALRTVAEAGLATVFADRDGKIRIEPLFHSGSGTVLKITKDMYFSAENPAKYGQIANEIVVEIQPLSPTATPQEVFKTSNPVTVPPGQTVKLTAQYMEKPVIDAVATLQDTTNTVIDTAVYYGWGAEITLRNSGTTTENVTVVINGRPLRTQGQELVIKRDENSITELGVHRFEFKNPLIQTREMAEEIAAFLLSVLTNPLRDVEMDWRGNPALELGDVVSTKGGEYVVIRNELTWDGALSAKLSGRKVN